MNKKPKKHAPPLSPEEGAAQALLLLSLCARLPLPVACTLRWGAVNVKKGCICLPDPGGQPYDLLLYLNGGQKMWMREQEARFRQRFHRAPGPEDYVFCGLEAGECRYRELLKP